MGAMRMAIGSGRWIGPREPCLIVAEIGQNHNGSLARAEELIDAAAWANADAVKLVKRDLECELSREARQRLYPGENSFGTTYGDHRRALELSASDHRALARRARDHGLAFLSTACDIPSADLLHSLPVDAFKIASRDLTNLPLVSHLAGLGRPVILSTGMSTWTEIDAAVEVLASRNCDFVLLQCTSIYPTPHEAAHLRSLATLRARYQAPVGFSDHTLGILLAPVAAALGAVVLEKHLTLDRRLKGTDHACSLEPRELQTLVANVRQVEQALGSEDKPLPPGVRDAKTKLGRSLVTRSALRAGTYLEASMLTLKCPGDGVSWLDREMVIGRRLSRDLDADEKLTLEDLA